MVEDMPDRDMVLMTITGNKDAGAPSLDFAAKQLGIDTSDIDADYGIVPLDPSRRQYGIRVRAGSLSPVSGADKPYSGPFSDPKIAPFGPIKSSK
jgi:hypothetical protein